jgi:hypothetical protein
VPDVARAVKAVARKGAPRGVVDPTLHEGRTRGIRQRAKSWKVSRLVSALAIAYLLVATFWGEYQPTGAGLDASWGYAINAFPTAGFHPGIDYNFTYGPLGFLLSPSNVGNNVAWAALFRSFTQAAFGALAAVAFAGKPPIGVVVSCVSYVFGVGLGLTLELHLLAICSLAAAIAVERCWWGLFFALAVLSAPLALLKFNLAIGAFAILASAAVLASSRRKWPALLSAAVICFHLALVAAVARIAIGTWNGVGNWARVSTRIADGYSVAMSLAPYPTFLPFGIATMLLIAALAAVAVRRALPVAETAAILLVPTFLAFKQSFVREDSRHVVAYFGFLACAGSLLMSRVRSRPGLAMGATAVGLIGAIALFAARDIVAETLPATMSGKRGFIAMKQLDVRATRGWLDAISADALRQDVLPSVATLAIANAHTVGVLPWEFSYCAANRLPCVPNPTLQVYAAYAPELDRATADQYSGANAPDAILFHTVGGIDGRNVLLDDPLLTRALLDGYRPVPGTADDWGMVLRRVAGERAQERTVGVATIKTGEWTSLPDTNELLLAEFHMRLSLRGRAAQVCLRVPPVQLDLEYASGRVFAYRLIPPTASGGLLLNAVPATSSEALYLFLGVPIDTVRRFRISGPGAKYYQTEVPVRWLELRHASVRREGPPPAACATSGEVHLDVPSGPILLDRNAALRLRGWAVLGRPRASPVAVRAVVDRRVTYELFAGIDRRDVAMQLGDPALRASGFAGSFPASLLGRGRHEITFELWSAGEECSAPSGSARVEIE